MVTKVSCKESDVYWSPRATRFSSARQRIARLMGSAGREAKRPKGRHSPLHSTPLHSTRPDSIRARSLQDASLSPPAFRAERSAATASPERSRGLVLKEARARRGASWWRVGPESVTLKKVEETGDKSAKTRRRGSLLEASSRNIITMDTARRRPLSLSRQFYRTSIS